MIYLDNAATTKIDSEVLDVFNRLENDFFANTTSIHKLGSESNYMFEKIKNEIKDFFKVPHNVVFTTNATESNNLAIQGILKNKKGTIVTTSIEHPSVYNVFKEYEKEGYNVVYLKVDSFGRININELKEVLKNDVILVSIMWVNNVVGSVEPIKDVIEEVKKYKKTKLHVDICQGLLKEVNDFEYKDIDLITFSTHKLYGPKGVGVLLYNKNLNLEKVLYGSNSQYAVKPGTVSLSLAGATLKCLKKFGPLTKKHYDDVKRLSDYFVCVLNEIDLIEVNSKFNNPYIVSFSICGIKSETFVHSLEEKEIYVSTGTSCSSKYEKKDRVIYEMTNDEKRAISSIRVSFSYYTTKEEIDTLIYEIKRSIKCMI